MRIFFQMYMYLCDDCIYVSECVYIFKFTHVLNTMLF